MKNNFRFLFSLTLLASLLNTNITEAKVFSQSVSASAIEEQVMNIKGKRLDSPNNPFKASLLLENNQQLELAAQVNKRFNRANRVAITLPKVSSDVKGLLRFSGGNVSETEAQVFPIIIYDNFTSNTSNNNDADAIAGNFGSELPAGQANLNDLKNRLKTLEDLIAGLNSTDPSNPDYSVLVNATQSNASNIEVNKNNLVNLISSYNTLNAIVNNNSGSHDELKVEVEALTARTEVLEDELAIVADKSRYISLKAALLSEANKIKTNPDGLDEFTARHLDDEKVSPVDGFIIIPEELSFSHSFGSVDLGSIFELQAQLILGDLTACYYAYTDENNSANSNIKLLYQDLIKTAPNASCRDIRGNGSVLPKVASHQVSAGTPIKLKLRTIGEAVRNSITASVLQVETPVIFIQKVDIDVLDPQ
jgi:hypothetical protein